MAAKDARRSGNPAVRASAPAPTGAKESLYIRLSRATLVRLARMPALTVPVVMLVLMLVGLYAPLPLALPALGIAAVFVLWLASVSWPVLDTKGRLLRGLMFGLIVGATVGRISGWI